jgi:hypothetical protein
MMQQILSVSVFRCTAAIRDVGQLLVPVSSEIFVAYGADGADCPRTFLVAQDQHLNRRSPA